MKLLDITNYLDLLFKVETFVDLDMSFSKRLNLFDLSVFNAMSSKFKQCLNGLMLRGSEHVECVVASCFLSDDFVEELKCENIKDSLVICHHMLDIDAGFPGEWCAKGFTSLSKSSFDYLFDNNISVYILHLPLDVNSSAINTHLAFCRALDLCPKADLVCCRGFDMGYIADSSCEIFQRIDNKFLQKFMLGEVPSEKALEQNPIALLAGMVSSVSILDEIAKTNCSLLICGDVLLRQKTKRAEEIVNWLKRHKMPILCLSHKKTEEFALIELLEHIQLVYPETTTKFMKGGTHWK